MSVILGCPDKSVKLLVKRADTSMFNAIDRTSNTNILCATETHLHNYSSLGLKTLAIGISEFEQCHSAFQASSIPLIGRAALLCKVDSNVENSLTILGAFAVEDKLQQGIPESIDSPRIAGIKVWVLTEDKQETAVSIDYSSKLLTCKIAQIIINNSFKKSLKKSLKDALVIPKKLMTLSGKTGNTGGSSGVAIKPSGFDYKWYQPYLCT